MTGAEPDKIEEVDAMEAPARAPAPALPLIARMVRMSTVYWAQLLGVVVLGSAFAGMRYLRAWLIQPALDEIALPALAEASQSNALDLIEPDRLMMLGALLLLTIVVTPPAMIGRMYLSGRVVSCVRRDVDQAVARSLLHAPLTAHEEGSTGDYVSRALADSFLAMKTLDVLYREMIMNVLMLAGGMIAMFLVSWQLATIAFATVIPIAILLRFFGARIHRKTERRQESQSDLMQQLVSMISGIKEIKIFRSEGNEDARFAEETQRFFKRNMRVIGNQVLAKGTTEALTQTLGAVLVVLGFYAVLNGHFDLTLGKLANFSAILVTVYKPVKGLTANVSNLFESVAGAVRLFELIDLEDERTTMCGAQPMPDPFSTIRFRDVGFSYGATRVLDGVNFEVKRGEFVAIVGATGSGKSTLIDLLLRFYEPTNGRVEIDGTDLTEISRDSFLDRVAVVAQEPFLFDATIAENIRYGRPDASDGAVEAAARVASAHEFIESQPAGYASSIGEAGRHLSHGQRQRIAIARAILADPEILVFDEATSALDTKTEKAVQDAIDATRGERTVLVIAHRLSTVRAADRILVLANGQIAESGTHDELLARQGLYAELVGAGAHS